MRHAHLLLCAALGAAPFGASACYTVYDRSDRVVYQSELPPVDMSRPLHETLAARYPGGHLVFDTAARCPLTDVAIAGRGTRDLATRSPLLTDERTAVAMRMPHTPLPGGIALVQPSYARLAPGLTVIPAARFATSGQNTAVMGAGPRSRPVITELRNAPQTVERSGGRPVLPKPLY